MYSAVKPRAQSCTTRICSPHKVYDGTTQRPQLAVYLNGSLGPEKAVLLACWLPGRKRAVFRLEDPLRNSDLARAWREAGKEWLTMFQVTKLLRPLDNPKNVCLRQRLEVFANRDGSSR